MSLNLRNAYVTEFKFLRFKGKQYKLYLYYLLYFTGRTYDTEEIGPLKHILFSIILTLEAKFIKSESQMTLDTYCLNSWVKK